MTDGRVLDEDAFDFHGAWERPVDERDLHSAEQWARAVFEEPPRLVRMFLLAGWRGVLGLRLGPSHDAGHVLGWRIEGVRDDELVLASQSWLMDAVNVVRLDAGRVRWVTYVRYRNSFARPVWALVLPVHILTISLLLRRAARHMISG